MRMEYKNLTEEVNRIKILSGVIKENLDNKIIDMLKKQIIPSDQVQSVKLVDNRPGKTNKIVKIQNDKVVSISDDNMNEGVRDMLKMAAVCTILASGMMSCTKEGSGYGYNLGTDGFKYNVNPSGDKTISVFSANGMQQYKVDSMSKTDLGGGSSEGSIFTRKITPTEAVILSLGMEKYGEELNNQHAPKNVVYDLVGDVSEVNYAKDGGWVADGTCRDDIRFKRGLQAIQQKGEDPNTYISKADAELAKGEFWNESMNNKPKWNSTDFSGKHQAAIINLDNYWDLLYKKHITQIINHSAGYRDIFNMNANHRMDVQCLVAKQIRFSGDKDYILTYSGNDIWKYNNLNIHIKYDGSSFFLYNADKNDELIAVFMDSGY
jgi:hypothetical protein